MKSSNSLASQCVKREPRTSVRSVRSSHHNFAKKNTEKCQQFYSNHGTWRLCWKLSFVRRYWCKVRFVGTSYASFSYELHARTRLNWFNFKVMGNQVWCPFTFNCYFHLASLCRKRFRSLSTNILLFALLLFFFFLCPCSNFHMAKTQKKKLQTCEKAYGNASNTGSPLASRLMGVCLTFIEDWSFTLGTTGISYKSQI